MFLLSRDFGDFSLIKSGIWGKEGSTLKRVFGMALPGEEIKGAEMIDREPNAPIPKISSHWALQNGIYSNNSCGSGFRTFIGSIPREGKIWDPSQIYPSQRGVCASIEMLVPLPGQGFRGKNYGALYLNVY